jgi:hypothetical protein
MRQTVSVGHTGILKGLQGPTIGATIDREFHSEGKAHGQESTDRDGYQLGVGSRQREGHVSFD